MATIATMIAVEDVGVPRGRTVDAPWFWLVTGTLRDIRRSEVAVASAVPAVSVSGQLLTPEEFAATRRLMEGNRASAGELRP